MDRFDNFPTNPAVQKPWLNWFRAHNINPEAVLLTGWVERDEETHQIRYLAFVGDKARMKPNSDDVWTEARTVQLDTAPLPFPVAA